nr:ATPase, F1/V1/A1 complex, alpha/beta subunit, zinc knuckle CX2CX4HX4C [Tanacetum cinerariifolium]
MRNVHMEAWSVKGISALASSIGKPVIMDEVTTKMYVTCIGRIGFAKVLVEIDAEKGIKDKFEVMYKSKNISEGTKKIEEEVVKPSRNGDDAWGSGSRGVSLADLIKGSKLDNKLMQISTTISDNEEGIVIFNDEIIELGSQK